MNLKQKKKIKSLFAGKIFFNICFVLISLFITYLLCLNYKPTFRNSDQLFSQYYHVYRLNDDIFSVCIENSEFKDVLNLYKQNKFMEAYNRLVVLNQDTMDTNTVNFIYGQLLLANDNYSSADTAFKSVIFDNFNPFVIDAHWYRGLSLLKKQDIFNAKVEFKLLSNINSEYTKSAKDILYCLEKA